MENKSRKPSQKKRYDLCGRKISPCRSARQSTTRISKLVNHQVCSVYSATSQNEMLYNRSHRT